MKIQISKKNILLALLMVVGQTAWADDGYKVTITDPTHIATNYASGISEGTTVTLTVTPVDAEYLKAADIVVIKTAPGGSAQARRRSTTFADAIPVTAVEVDARGAGTYSFYMPASDVEVSADYHARTALTTDMFNDLLDVTYNGSAFTPEVTSATLTLNTDYTVSYSNNTNAGTATAAVTGVGIYMGTVDKTFTINQASLDGATINGIDANYAFTNSAITPEYTVTFNGVAVAETEYDAEWSGNTNVGTATLTLTASASATNFTPGTQQTATFEIINPSAPCGENLTYEYDPVANTIIISGTGDMTDYSTTNPAPWASFIDADTKVFAPTGVTVDPDAVPEGTDVFNFETNGDNVTITGYQGDNDVVEIPATVGGNTVTNIAEGAFTGSNSQPEVILIPHGNGEDPAITVAANATGEGTAQLTYKEESGNITITDIGGSSDEVVIPATIDGKDVTKVDVTDAPATGTVLIPTGATTTGTLPDNTDVFAYTEQTDSQTGETTATITGYTGNSDVVEVPASIGGNDVTGIAAGTFTGEGSTPTTVMIPETNESGNAIDVADGATGNGTTQLTYKEENGDITITGYTGNGGTVEIPTTVGNNPVTGIEDDVFTGENAPSTVLVPSTVTDSDGAFDNDKTDQFTYTEQTDSQTGETTATITGYTGNSDVVEVPTSVGGKDVATIAEGAFTGDNDSPKTVLIPEENENGHVITSTGATGEGTSKLTYTEDETTGHVTITGYEGTAGSTVEIPSTIGGNDVTGVSSGAFIGDDAPATVLVPESAKNNVENGAFENTTGQMTYQETTDQETGASTGIEITGYTAGDGQTSVEIPAEIGGTPVTTIGDDAFAGQDVDVTVPETVVSDPATDDPFAGVGGSTGTVTHDLGGGVTMTTKTESTTKMLTVIESGNSADCANAQRIPNAVTEVQLTYQRTLTVPGSTSEMYTICLPYVPDADDNLKYYTLSDADGETLSFVEVLYSNLAANKPYLVVASSDVSVGKAMTSPINMGAATISSSALGGYQLCGTLLGMTHAEAVAAGAYILQDDGVWHKVTDESETTQKAYIPPFRAYIVKASGGGNARLYSEFDTSTGVNTIRANEDETINNDWYTLDGRKINGKPTVKGIYIKENGEKVVK